MRWAMAAAWASPAIASSSATKTAWDKSTAINIFRIPPDAVKNPPVQVGEIPAMAQGDQGFDDRELRSLAYTGIETASDRQILVRNGGTQSIGRELVYDIDLDSLSGANPPAASTISAASRMSFICGMTRRIRTGSWCT